jgi:hypothetical protein
MFGLEAPAAGVLICAVLLYAATPPGIASVVVMFAAFLACLVVWVYAQ